MRIDKKSLRYPWHKIPVEFGTTRHDTPEYHTERWRRLRKRILNRDSGLCMECAKNGKVRRAVMVDHIIPIAEGGHMWDENNLQSLCAHCHQTKTNKEIARRRSNEPDDDLAK